MSEALFRSKGKDSGEWVYGWYCRYQFGKWPLKDAIIPSEEAESGCFRFVEVDPSTVGRYTCLTDKNGKRIFEGDVVEYREYGNLVVVWDDGAFQLMREDTFYDMLDHYTTEFSVVAGNIYDNPELLEEKE